MKMTLECRPDLYPHRPWKYTISIGSVSGEGFCTSMKDCLIACEDFVRANTVHLYEDLMDIPQQPIHYSS